MFSKLKGTGTAIILGLMLSLGGCTPKDLVVHDPATLVTPADKVNASIDQAYATHASVTITLLQNYKDGVITRDEKNSYAKRTKEGLDYIDRADDLLIGGDISAANAQVALAKSIFTAIQLELTKRSK